MVGAQIYNMAHIIYVSLQVLCRRLVGAQAFDAWILGLSGATCMSVGLTRNIGCGSDELSLKGLNHNCHNSLATLFGELGVLLYPKMEYPPKTMKTIPNRATLDCLYWGALDPCRDHLGGEVAFEWPRLVSGWSLPELVALVKQFP